VGNVGKLDNFPILAQKYRPSGNNRMTGNSVVRARIDERTKREAAAALKKIGSPCPMPFAAAGARPGRRAEQTAAKSECGRLILHPLSA
jgi:hypothetical protein